MDPIIGSALIGGTSSLLGNLFNIGSQRTTNAQNLAIAKMNNQFNERMMEKQMAYNTEFWNKSNEYNNPNEQRKRLEAAGLNPYLMMNGGSAGTAANTLGVNAPSAAPATMVAPQVDSNSFGQSVSQLAGVTSIKHQNDNLQMLTKTGEQLAQSQVLLNKALEAYHGENKGYIKSLKETQDRLNDLQEINFNDLSLGFQLDRANKYMQVYTQQVQATSMIIQQQFELARLPYAETFASNEAAMQGAQIALLYSQGKLNRAKALEAFSNITLNAAKTEETNANTKGIKAKTYGQKLSNMQVERTFNVTVQAVKANQQYLTTLYNAYQGLGGTYFQGERIAGAGSDLLKGVGSVIP